MTSQRLHLSSGKGIFTVNENVGFLPNKTSYLASLSKYFKYYHEAGVNSMK